MTISPTDAVAPPSLNQPRSPWRIDPASAWMLGAAASMATMGAMVHQLGDRSDWLVVALVRTLVMMVTAAVLVRASRLPLVIWRPRSLWVRSLAGSFSLVCNFFALTRLPVADAVTLSNVHPLWIVLITAASLRRWPAWPEALGVVSGLCGVILLQRPDLGNAQGLAVLVALVSSVSTSVAMLGLHRLRGIDSRAVVAHFAGVASAVAAIWLVVRWDRLNPTAVDPGTIAMLLGVGAAGTLGQILLTKAYSAGAPSKVAVVGLTQVVFAMGYDVAIWGRSLSPLTALGFVLVLAPTTWLSIRSSRKLAATAGPATRPVEPVDPL